MQQSRKRTLHTHYVFLDVRRDMATATNHTLQGGSDALGFRTTGSRHRPEPPVQRLRLGADHRISLGLPTSMYVLPEVQYVLRKEHSIGPGLRVCAKGKGRAETRPWTPDRCVW